MRFSNKFWKQTIRRVLGRLIYRWIDRIKPLGKVSMSLLQSVSYSLFLYNADTFRWLSTYGVHIRLRGGGGVDVWLCENKSAMGQFWETNFDPASWAT